MSRNVVENFEIALKVIILKIRNLIFAIVNKPVIDSWFSV